MKPLTVFLLSTLLFYSCNGKSHTPRAAAPAAPAGPAVRGDTVSAISQSIWSVYQDRHNIYWFGSNGEGLYRYDGKTLVQFTTQHGLNNNQIRRIQEDKDGNLYLSTGLGISRFDGHSFTTLRADTSLFGQIGKPSTDRLWLQGSDGAYGYDGTKLQQLRLPKTLREEAYYRQYPGTPISPKGVYYVYQDSKGHVWFGTEYLGVCRYDGSSFLWLMEQGLAESAVRSIYEDRKGNYYFGNSGEGLYQYDGEKLTNLRHTKGIGGGKPSDRISYNAITGDSAGVLWIATYDFGVWRYDGQEATHYPVMEGTRPVHVCTIYYDRQGHLWLGTNEDGLYRWNGKSFEKVVL